MNSSSFYIGFKHNSIHYIWWWRN